jgi:VIT1/CCC1 family predicted Fe2+/Mn2+ transporter
MSPVTQADEHADENTEKQGDGLNNRLNWLRAGVLGANDGIVSVAGMVMGVAGSTDHRSPILIAGVAALVAGAISMAAGEYVSVSTQRDAEEALLDKERQELKDMPEQELAELQEILESKGLSSVTAKEVARELTERDALQAHAEFELGFDPGDVNSPWNAAFASLISFTVGAILPLITILLPSPWRFWITALAVLVALAFTGFTSAKLGYARPGRAVVRNMVGGAIAMGITYAIGAALGTTVS